MFKKSFFVVTPIIGVTVLLFIFGILTLNSKYTQFESNGHIIAKSDKAATTKYFFDNKTKYKTVGDDIILNTSNNKEIKIPAETFIHYSDGSISTFKKSAVLDLNDLDKNNYKYYNIYQGGIFVKTNDGYTINYLDKKLKFTNFLLKISDTKFMVVGSDIKLDIDGTTKEIKNSYLEVTYLDGGLIKIENQNAAFQSVSDNVTIALGNDVIIDFVGKNIYKDAARKLSLGEITIDSDDNIEINTKENETIVNSQKKKKGGSSSNNDSEGGSSTTNSTGTTGGTTTEEEQKNKLPNVNSGVVDTSEDTIEEIIDENARIKDADFKIANMNVTANRITAEIFITDQDSVLQGAINIKIIETNTNKIIYEYNDDSGSNMIEIDNESLLPETNYILVLNSDYRKNDVTYNKDFVQKTFITDAIGVDVEKYFVSENQLSVNLKKASYSDISTVEVALEDAEERTLKTMTVTLEEGDNIIDFIDLTYDTLYKVRVYNFAHQDSAISDNYAVVNKYETLKRKPKIGGTSFTMDKKESKFNMQLNNVIDSDGAITSYKYELYDDRDIVAGNNPSPITVIEKTSSASASVKVDGKDIKRGVPYVFRVVLTFNDNEKEYEEVTDYSGVMKLDGVVFPIIKFNKTEVTYERIIGEIEIIDEGNTIDIASGTPITITYTDSVGNSNSFISSGTYKIPVDVNNLRANETYSFSVTARVDLQDDNAVIDSCYIGSVIVQTEDPKPFKVEYNEVSNTSYAFSLNAQLVDGKNGSTELEANTLTGITFNLYAGKTTAGRLIKTIKNVDKLDAPYSSELRGIYYDNQFRIDPAFFGIRNSDLTSDFYTIEITSAYDYTTYKNNLPIDNNTYTVKTEALLPDLPSNPEDSMEVVPVYNRDMPSGEVRADLDRGTVVQYKFRAAFDNSKKYAKRITYEVHDDDGTLIDTIVDNIDDDGEIKYREINVGDGLEEGNTDGTLRRGRGFYISYVIELDTNYDGNINLTYPLSGILRGTSIYPERQVPKFKFYPTKSDGSNYKWKYTYTDVDHALVDKKVAGKLDSSTTNEQTLSIGNTYKEVTFNVNKAGFFAITGQYNLVDGEDYQDAVLTRQFYEGVKTLDFGKIRIYPEKNRIIFSFVDFNNKMELFEKISAVKIDFVTDSKTVTLDGLSAATGNITINYSKLEELMGKTITPVMTVYYDSGMYGFENSGDAFALQQIKLEENGATYYYTYDNDKFTTVDSANGSYLTYNFTLNPTTNINTLSLHDKRTNTSADFEAFVSNYGVNYNGSYVSPKKLNTLQPTVQGTSTFSFDSIVPGVSILNNAGLSDIRSYVNAASFNFTTYGVENKLQNDKVSVEVYKYDQSVSNATIVDTIEYDLETFNGGITINGLMPDTNYFLRVFGYVKTSGGNYEKTYLYDVDQLRDGVNYYFKTIGNIGIRDARAYYWGRTYSERYFVLSYTLPETIGVTYIKYKLYKIVDGSRVEINTINIPNSTSRDLKEKMVKNILIPNTAGITTGNTYDVEITPVFTTTIDGNSTDIELESTYARYTFNDLFKPYFSVQQTIAGTVLEYRVNIRDNSKAIVDGKYRIQITDQNGNDITPDAYKNQNFLVSQTNKLFTLPEYNSSTQYIFNIIYSMDYKNDSSTIQQYVNSSNSQNAVTGEITLGNVYAAPDSADNTKVNLRFFDSNKLTDAKTIIYSIYNENGESIDSDGEENFRPTLASSGDTAFYVYQLNKSVVNDGIYYISIQFLGSDKKILAETTVEYRLLS